MNGECGNPKCEDRHPELCKFWNSTNKCRRNDTCDFLHKILENIEDDKAEFKCIGCKNVWDDKECVVRHMINGRETFFCLNCQDWVKFKTRVHDSNWSLFDESGYLKVDI